MDRRLSGSSVWRPQRAAWGVFLLAATAYLWLFPFTPEINNPNEMVRVYAVRALVETGDYSIGTRGPTGDHGPIYDAWGYVNDKALFCTDGRQAPDCHGRLYQAKAPGLTFLGALPLWVLNHARASLHLPPPTKAQVVWWLRFWVVILPTLLAWTWLARWLPTRLDRPGLGLAAVLAAALGSLSLTYGQMFAGHQPGGVALLALFAAIVAAGRLGNPGAVLLAGLAGGWAVIIEFTMAPAVVILGLWLLARRRDPRDLVRLAVGGALPIVLLLHNNWRSFGSPLQLSYSHLENPGFVRDMAPGFMGIHLPTEEKVVGSLLSPFTGLYFWAPWMVLAWLGWLALGRSRASAGVQSAGAWLLDRRGEAAVAGAVCLYFLFFQCTHSLWRGGWVVGPRYITAMVPFAAIAAAHGLDAIARWKSPVAPLLLSVGGVAAIVITGAGSAVSQGFPFEVYNPLPEVVEPLLRHGWIFWNPAMLRQIAYPWNALPYVAALGGGALWLVWLAWRDERRSAAMRLVGVLASVALAAGLVHWQWRDTSGRTVPDRMVTLNFLQSVWEPRHPPGSRPIVLPQPTAAAPR